ncbi:MAG: serine/threonine-protein kinase [Anaerolineae bacterium]
MNMQGNTQGNSLVGLFFNNKYQIEKLIGQGGMGAVYRAFQPDLERHVAIKVLPAGLAMDADFVKRFNREARTIAQLHHPNIVPIYDAGSTADDIRYIVMPYLSGGTLADRMEREGTLPSLKEVGQLLRAIADALDYAHSKNVVHRDIKASNILFDEHGKPLLVDFGIAKLLVDDTSSGHTRTGITLGTLSYMSPEQWRGEAITGATDQYALGVLVYLMVTGRLPFDAPSAPTLMYKTLYETSAPPHLIRPGLPATLAPVLNRAMGKQPADRYAKTNDFAQAFEEAVAEKPDMPTALLPKVARTPGPQAPVVNAPTPTPKPGDIAKPTDNTYVGLESTASTGLATGTGPTSSSGSFSKSRSIVIPVPTLRTATYWAVGLIALIVVGGIVIALIGNRGAAGDTGTSGTATATNSDVVILPSSTTGSVQVAASDTPLAVAQIESPTATTTEPPTATTTDTATIEPLTATITETELPATAPLILASDTATFTKTATRTFTLTYTATFTDTATATETKTLTATFTPTFTATDTATKTFTLTFTPSYTRTFTPTRTFTATFTPLPTDTPTEEATAPDSRVVPPTDTPTRTPVPSRTPIPTRTPRPTRTPIPTRTPTVDRTAVALANAQSEAEQLIAQATNTTPLLSLSDVPLRHTPGRPVLGTASRSVKNFVCEVEFTPPFDGNWDFMIRFRVVGQSAEWRLVFNSLKQWGILPFRNGQFGDLVGFGEAQNYSITPAESNQVVLVVNDDDAYLFINDHFSGKFDVSALTNAGTVQAGIGHFDGGQKAGAVTNYSITVYSLD